jgi:hypothetical protein
MGEPMKKPKGFKAFDNLMRNLVKVKPGALKKSHRRKRVKK